MRDSIACNLSFLSEFDAEVFSLSDRDLINTFIAIVKECADEVKHAASSIRKDVDSNIAETTKETAAVISKSKAESILQWNLVITRSLGPWKLPCYIRFLIISG